MRVMLTGSTGFIGSSLLPMLKKQGWEVFEVVRYISGGRYNYYDYSEHKNLYFADLRDRDAIHKAVMDCHPDVIINLAAQTAVSFSFINPIDVQETNFVAVATLAEAAREAKVKHFIHASTSEVYGKAKVFPITEDTSLAATSPYAVAKIAAENYLWLMHEISGFPVTIMRPFNTYGRAGQGVQNRHYVVERAICQALERREIHLHNPYPKRDFLFRLDHCGGYVMAVKAGEKVIGEAINLSTGLCWTIKEMAEMVAKVVTEEVGSPIKISFDEEPDRPKDIDILHGSNDKARELLGWIPNYDLKDGIRQAVKEWRSVLEK